MPIAAPTAQTLAPAEEEVVSTDSAPQSSATTSGTGATKATTTPQSAMAAPSTTQTVAQSKKNPTVIKVDLSGTVRKLNY